MNKAIIITTVAVYLLGAGLYFIIYFASHWGDPTYLGYVAAEAFTGGLQWPYKIYAWIRFDTPVM